ncbi:MAG: zf-TFIIB domain-containing protein [Elusimicrobiota bacterium]
MKCPKCVGKLQKKEIKVYEQKGSDKSKDSYGSYGLEVDQCFVCKGVWFDKGEFEKYNTDKLTIIDSPALGGDLDRELDTRKGKCPRCDIELDKTPYEKDRSITLDVCSQCGGTWLDSTEIDRIEKVNRSGFLGSLLKRLKIKK